MHHHETGTRTSTASGPGDAAVRGQLHDVVESDEFAGSERRRKLLQYLVEETLAGRGDSLKAYRIGRTALGRPSGFDPQSDPIVRVEIGRLRATLDRYYRAHPEAPVVISIPKGRYVAEFAMAAANTAFTRNEASARTVQIQPFSAHASESVEAAEAVTEALASLLAGATNDPAAVTVADEFVATEGACRVRGSVRTVNDRVRVGVEVFLPGHTRPTARRSFDDRFTNGDQFDVVDRLAERIGWLLLDDWGPVSRSGIRLRDRTPSRSSRPAIQHYYEAFEQVDPADIAAAADHLAPVSSEDPVGLAALSDATTVSWLLGVELGSEARDRAEELALRAVALAPKLVEAHLALGYAHFTKSRSTLMEREFDVALGLGPPSPNTLHCVAIMYALDGSWERGEVAARQAVEKNPDLPRYWHMVPCIAALHRGEFEQAYVESVQIGDTIGFVGPALRLASAHPLGLASSEDAKQFGDLTPEAGVQSVEDTVARPFHDPVIRDLVMQAVDATGIS